MSNLLLSIVNPCLIITVYQTEYNSHLVKGLLISFILAIIAHVIAIFVAQLAIRKDPKNANYAIERFASIYSNCGFIGIPLLNSVLGAEGVFYLTAYMTVFNIMTWTHGLSLLKGNLDMKCLKEGMRSPMVVATLIAVFLYFTQWKLPTPLLDSMNYVANMNTPLAMMVAGFSVAQSNYKQILNNIRLYWVCFIKLLLVPLSLLLFLWAIKVDYKVAYTTLIAAACPTATTTTMMSIKFNKNYTYASEMFSFSTMLSILTIPFIVFCASFCFS